VAGKAKKNTNSTRRPVLPDVFGAPDQCECPTCCGAEVDPRRLIDELTAGAAELVVSEDPLDAEIAGAAFVSIGEIAGEDFQELLVGGFIPEFEARATPEALAMLLAIGSVAQARAGKAALAAADRLVEAGIRYTYDFGDDWEHDILVEKVFDRDEAASYPRCTAGQRATPPEDCGGIWGYHNLTDVLTDPTHPEHEDTLEWLGLDHATEFDPASFDAKTVTQALSRLR
jgi:hypothetical protein